MEQETMHEVKMKGTLTEIDSKIDTTSGTQGLPWPITDDAATHFPSRIRQKNLSIQD